MKKDFHRRDLLKGLLALPGAAAMSGLMSSCGKNEDNSNSKSQSAANDAKTAVGTTIVDFSVVVHGTCALQFDTQNKQVQIIIPRVLENGKEAHQYLSGLFLNEKPLTASSTPIVFSLSANNPLPDVVSKDPSHDDPRDFVILRKRDVQPDLNGPVRNIFQLPYPKSLAWLRAEKFNSSDHKFFDNAVLIPKMPKQVPLILALQYDLALQYHASSEGPFPMANIHYHIFAEPEVHQSNIKLQQEHIKTAFSALTSLYKDREVRELTISKDVLNDVGNDGPDTSLLTQIVSVPSGFDPRESQSLELRSSNTGGGHLTCAAFIVVSGPDA